MSFTVTAIHSDVAQRCLAEIDSGVRSARRVTLDEAGAPCRHCLQPGRIGEEMMLFTYQPFTGESPYTVPSPIFLHADHCVRYELGRLPALARNGQ